MQQTASLNLVTGDMNEQNGTKSQQMQGKCSAQSRGVHEMALFNIPFPPELILTSPKQLHAGRLTSSLLLIQMCALSCNIFCVSICEKLNNAAQCELYARTLGLMNVAFIRLSDFLFVCSLSQKIPTSAIFFMGSCSTPVPDAHFYLRECCKWCHLLFSLSNCYFFNPQKMQTYPSFQDR